MRVAGRAVSAGAAGRMASGFAGSGAMTPSDSVTGAPGAAGAPDTAGALVALVALAKDWFWRTARYEPPAAAARHPTDNPATTSLLNSMFMLRMVNGEK